MLGLFIPMENLLPVVVTTLVFVLIGLIVFALAFVVITKWRRSRSAKRSKTIKTSRSRS